MKIDDTADRRQLNHLGLGLGLGLTEAEARELRDTLTTRLKTPANDTSTRLRRIVNAS